MNKLSQKEIAFAILVVVITVVMVVPVGYIIAVVVGGIIMLAFGHRLLKKDNNENK